MRTPLLASLLIPLFLIGPAVAATDAAPATDRSPAGAPAPLRIAQMDESGAAHWRGGYRYRDPWYDDRYRYRHRAPPRERYSRRGRDWDDGYRAPPPRRAYYPRPYRPRHDPYCGPFARYGGIYCESWPH